MSYSADERLPEDYFKEVMEEKAEMLRRYLEDLGDPLIFSSHCGYTMATFKFYSYDDEDSLKLHYTFFAIWETWKTSCTSYGCNLITY